MQDENRTGNEKARIGKARTSDVERDRDKEYEIAGNVRERGENPSPDDRARGERASNDPAGLEDSDRG